MEISDSTINPDEPYSWLFLGDIYDYRWQVAERRELFLEVERLYEGKSKGISDDLQVALDQADPEDHEDIVDSYVWDLRYVDHELPSIQRAATFIMLIHFAESRFTTICDGIADELTTAMTLKNLKGSGVEKAVLFLQKHSQLDLAELSSTFNFLRGCKHLRNALVHNGGVISDKNKVAANFVQNEPTLEGQSTGEIYVTAALINKFLDYLEKIFIGIHEAMEAFMRKGGNNGHVYLIGAIGRAPVFGPDPLTSKSRSRSA